jgi:hypothetical protein
MAGFTSRTGGSNPSEPTAVIAIAPVSHRSGPHVRAHQRTQPPRELRAGSLRHPALATAAARWQPLPGPQMEPSSGCSGSHATRCRARTDPTSNAATRRPAPRKNKAGVQLALLVMRWQEVGDRVRGAGTRRVGCGRRRFGYRSCRARRRDSRRRCVLIRLRR